MGGVVQIFTRPPGVHPAGTGRFETGSDGLGIVSVFASSGQGPISAVATFRGVETDGERDNSDWTQRNGSLRIEGTVSGSVRGALEVAVLDGDAGVPGAVGAESPRARGTFREERIALPVSFTPLPGHGASFLIAHVRSAPTYRNPDDPYFGSSDTDARTLQARISDAWEAGGHRLVAFASWESWTVDASDSLGTFLEGAQTRIWGAGVQDSFALGRGWLATAGARVDRHSEFGGAVSPRISASWLSKTAQWKVRASAGTAFRAPSVGELYYPYVGNAGLDPERSRSYEAGVERYLAGGRAEISTFWNDFQDLIVYDFAASRNENVGRARTRGVEAAFRRRIGARTDLDLGYTYLSAEDSITGVRLVRRPRHRAYAAAALRPAPRLLTTVRATFVGSRPDRDGVTFQPVTSPSYLRVDLYAAWETARVRPFARIDNVTDRRYEEADGYPAPGIRFACGLELRLGARADRKE
jgi:vitamin B12 transporter